MDEFDKDDEYGFIGFYKDEACTEVFDVTTATKSTTVYAKFNKATYSVTYNDGVEGTVVFKDQTTEHLKYGDTTPAFKVNGTAQDPVREGFDFAGWKDAAENAPSETVTGTVTYFAQWTPKNYTVSYTILNDEFKNNEPSDVPVTFGSVYTVASKPNDEAGYEFKGWTLSRDDVEDATKTKSSITIESNVELFGKYVPKSDTNYTVHYYIQNGDDNNYTLQEKATINATGTTGAFAVFSTSDDKFVGYHYKETKVGEEVKSDSSSIKILGDGSLVIDVYYDANTYTVTYAYDGTVPEGVAPTEADLAKEPYTKQYRVGQTVTIADDATALGYTFSGWKAQLEGIGTQVQVEESEEQQNPVVSAIKAFLTFVSTRVETETGSKEVKTFKMPARNVLVSGSFAQDHYTVTYIYQKDKEETDKETEEKSFVYENKVYGDVTPTYSAYTVPTGKYFVGWIDDNNNLVQNEDIAKTTVTGNLTFTAKYNDKHIIHIVIRGNSGIDDHDTTLPYNGETQTADMNFTIEVHVNGEVVESAKADSNTVNMLLASLDSMKNFGSLIVFAADESLSEIIEESQDQNTEYNGQEQASEKTVISKSFDLEVDGQTHNYTVEVELGGGQGQHVNEEGYPIVVNNVSVTSEGKDASDQFDMDIKEGDTVGHLYVTKAPLKVTTGSATRVYNGSALTKDEAAISGLQAGETAEIHATGSQTAVGSSVNGYKITWNGTALESDYDTDKIDETGLGTLTVTPVESDDTPSDPGTPSEPSTPQNFVPAAGQVLGAVRGTGAADGAAVLGARRGRTEDTANTLGRIITIIVAAGIGFTMIFIKRKKKEEK